MGWDGARWGDGKTEGQDGGRQEDGKMGSSRVDSGVQRVVRTCVTHGRTNPSRWCICHHDAATAASTRATYTLAHIHQDERDLDQMDQRQRGSREGEAMRECW